MLTQLDTIGTALAELREMRLVPASSGGGGLGRERERPADWPDRPPIPLVGLGVGEDVVWHANRRAVRGPKSGDLLTRYAPPNGKPVAVVRHQLTHGGMVKLERLKFSFDDHKSAITSDAQKRDWRFGLWIDDCEWAGTQDRDERPFGRPQGEVVVTRSNIFNAAGSGGAGYLIDSVLAGVVDDGRQGGFVAINVDIHMAKRDDALGVRVHPDGVEVGGRHPAPFLENVHVYGWHHGLGMIVGGVEGGVVLGSSFRGSRSMELGSASFWQFMDCVFPMSVTLRGRVRGNHFKRCRFATVGEYALDEIDDLVFEFCDFQRISDRVRREAHLYHCTLKGVPIEGGSG